MIGLRVAADVQSAALTAIQLIAMRFPGNHELAVIVGDRRLVLGPEWRYDASEACLAALSEFGEAGMLAC